jgi:hypothetical protein
MVAVASTLRWLVTVVVVTHPSAQNQIFDDEDEEDEDGEEDEEDEEDGEDKRKEGKDREEGEEGWGLRSVGPWTFSASLWHVSTRGM